MIHADFAHLHVHTQYSLLDGACHLSNLVRQITEYRMPAVAMTDHGNMFGAVEFYQFCMHAGIKPIIGCEAYSAPGSRFDKSINNNQETAFHLTLLAKDEAGYKNLMKLVSLGYLEGFYYKPRIDKELLRNYSKGLIALSGCMKSEVSRLILNDNLKKARETIDEYKEIFGRENFYLELQDNLIRDQIKINSFLIKVSKEDSIPLAATNDVHYIKKEHARAHEALLCIGTQTTLDDPNRLKFQTDEFYLKSADEMAKVFKDIPEAIKNTIQIVEKCNLELDFKQIHLPQFVPPNGLSREQYLRDLVHEGLSHRYEKIEQNIKDRVEHELKIINQNGYTSYFLIAWDFVINAKSKGIAVGPGRGSSAGSVVSYALGITDLDPLRYNLIFERFLNPERVSLPDIDIDFCYERRNEVIDYVTKKYSNQNVAQIITFGTMQAKAAVRDVGRVMNMPYSEVDRIAKMIPPDPNISLAAALKSEPELKNLYENDPQVTQLIDTSLVLEGLTRHASTHAAGVVISDQPLINYIPLFKTGEQISTGFAMNSLERIGLLKMDFLGLRTLTVIQEAVKLIKETKEIDIQIDKIPLDDKKAFTLLRKGESFGVFQLESSGMRDLLKKLAPERLEDIIALLALFRPGPIGSGMVDDFIKRKHGQIPIRYDHPLLEPILKETYGICIFQEQVIMIASALAGFSMSQADLLRRAISKKTPEIMEQQRRLFVEGAIKRGINWKIAEKIFNLIEYFAGYGFAKSHSTAYAMISYRTAYLKANFPVEFMTALLTSEKDNTDKIVLYISECERMGIKILPPDINESDARFKAVGSSIRFGLSAVKNIGQAAIDSILEARRNFGKFSFFYEFCEKVDSRTVNRKVIESLIKCGALDCFGFYRSQMTSILDKALEMAWAVQKDRQKGQFSFFDLQKESNGFKKVCEDLPQIKEFPESQLLSFEKEVLGFYITGHPLAKYEKLLKTYVTATTANLSGLRDGSDVAMGGILSKVKQTETKKTGERMAILNLEDLDGAVEALVFPKAFKNSSRFIKKDALIFLSGKVNLREETPKIIANEIIPLNQVRQKYTKEMQINLFTPGLEEQALDTIKKALADNKGDTPVYLCFSTAADRQEVKMLVDRGHYVRLSDELVIELEKLAGEGNVICRR